MPQTKIKLESTVTATPAPTATSVPPPTATSIPELTATDYILRGNEFTNEGKYEEAIGEYNAAIELDSTKALAFYNRGVAEIRLGWYFDAIYSLDLSIKLK